MLIGQSGRNNINYLQKGYKGSTSVNEIKGELTKNLFKFESRFEGTDMRFKPNPNWSTIATSQELQRSDENIIDDIKKLAKKHFNDGTEPKSDMEFNRLSTEFISKVSPDRKQIFKYSMNKTGGKMNISCAFFDKSGSVVLTYNPHNSTYSPRYTEEEFARFRQFNQMYNEEYDKLKDSSAYVDLRPIVTNSSFSYEI